MKKREKTNTSKNTNKKGNQFDYAEIYRQLRTNIEYSSFEKNLQVINFTSTNPSEGKSSVVSNLAMVSVAKYKSVLLIDCDLRKPVQHKLFQVSNKVGLSDLIRNFENFDVREDTYFQKFKDKDNEGKLYLLSAGTKIPNPQEMLASEKFKSLIEKLRSRFDFILIDCPPISAVADAIPISNVSDGTIFIVSAKDTNKNDARTALTQLQRNGVNVLGAVLTKVDAGPDHYYSYYYSDK
ncbi:MAG: CpsD/CapB family tyrosine-protein kinase [Erysipelotrichaceae bacterium]